MLRRLLAKPLTWVVLAVLVVGGAAGLYWFEPWRLFTDTTVHDTVTNPSLAPSVAVVSGSPGAVPGAVVVRTGSFVSHEHDTSGTARLVRNADGSYQLELVGLATSDGPDLRVWLTDQEVTSGTSGWRVFDDGVHVELGKLKGNKGDQVYAVPANVDPLTLRSVTIWCKRFSVSFGAAALN